MFKKLKEKLVLSTNRKNVLKISSGTTLGFLISIFTLPIVTRIYGAEVIGIWALFNSLAVIINSFSDLGLTNSIMVENEEKLERNYKVITTISLFTSIFTGLIITFLYHIFIEDIKINFIFFFFILFTITFITQQIQICYTWLNRKSKYNVLMKNPLINNLINGLLSIIFGVLGFITYGYFLAIIIGQLMTLLHMKRNLPRGMFNINFKDYKDLFKSNKKFILFQAPTNIVGIVKSQLPILLIKIFWGNNILGYYSIAIKLLQIPSALLASAIGRVFFQITSKMQREDRFNGHYVLKNISFAMKIALIPMAFLTAFGDLVIVIFLGEEWEISGNIIRILALYFFFAFLITSVQGLAIVINKQKYTLLFNIAQLFISFICLTLGKLIFDNLYYALILMSCSFILSTICYFGSLLKAMEVKWISFLKLVLFNLILVLIISVTLRGCLTILINHF